jgi:hypothetical protein
MEKEIVEYKLKFAEYIKAANTITGTSTDYTKNGFIPESFAYKKLKEAGVLDLWFQPVFAPDKPKLPTINGKQCVDNGDKTITCGCTTKSFDWILGVDYAMGEEIDISGTGVSDKEIRQIVEYINKK